ncbi:VPLPA-CTERM sorting domain-containing protein [Alteromonas sp. 5E99-2]|uniref:nidogen-like domain-containing protein n=1 Tax=Alteromonas sp. 5E99-2 TaxID=2817683 RepID=UPI001A9859A4|nr:nidogen-like domain-containing protein [Alteromonas sp. 5E99-2]MBO1256274.1 VPLPA-CTERM sorting domain-containing protein [Alteromonas sp. 5E99-2]
MKLQNLIAALTLPFLVATNSYASAIVDGFNSNSLAANDDGSTGLVDIGFSLNFFDSNFSQLFVNNNGNITFESSLSTFSPFDLTSTGQSIIAPFFADVDTRNGGTVSYGEGSFDGFNAFGVNYIDVAFFGGAGSSNTNTFQLLLVDRSDIGSGDFDILFNYEQILFETGTASDGDENGLGGSSARVGFSNGSGDIGTSFELTGSAINGAFLDGGVNSLVDNSFNSDIDGRYIFNVRNGSVDFIAEVPAPAPISILMLVALAIRCYRKSK